RDLKNPRERALALRGEREGRVLAPAGRLPRALDAAAGLLPNCGHGHLVLARMAAGDAERVGAVVQHGGRVDDDGDDGGNDWSGGDRRRGGTHGTADAGLSEETATNLDDRTVRDAHWARSALDLDLNLDALDARRVGILVLAAPFLGAEIVNGGDVLDARDALDGLGVVDGIEVVDGVQRLDPVELLEQVFHALGTLNDAELIDEGETLHGKRQIQCVGAGARIVDRVEIVDGVQRLESIKLLDYALDGVATLNDIELITDLEAFHRERQVQCVAAGAQIEGKPSELGSEDITRIKTHYTTGTATAMRLAERAVGDAGGAGRRGGLDALGSTPGIDAAVVLEAVRLREGEAAEAEGEGGGGDGEGGGVH
ncbi:hypothetical protein DFH06DRAFT_1421075, partial [Mycena polygramma]